MANRICSIDDCDAPWFKREWCSRHYRSWHQHGDPLKARRKLSSSSACVIDACGRTILARDMCSGHYQAWRRSRRETVGRICSINWCDDLAQSRGWCPDHYQRWYDHGSPTHRYPFEVVNGKRICPRCGVDSPVRDWINSWCRSCFGEYNRDRQHRRCAQLAAAAVGPAFTRLEVLERDGWVCQICTEPIERGRHFPDPLSASLDHAVPLVLGGAHSLRNTQASHLLCNLRKGASAAA